MSVDLDEQITDPLFTVVEAAYRPQRLDTLRVEHAAVHATHIGRRLRWQCCWLIDDEDGGDYVGQHAWEPLEQTDPLAALGWVPTEDLGDPVMVPWEPQV